MQYSVSRTEAGFFTITGVDRTVTLSFDQAMALYRHIEGGREAVPAPKDEPINERDFVLRVLEAVQCHRAKEA
jgi:hypothetical protein